MVVLSCTTPERYDGVAFVYWLRYNHAHAVHPYKGKIPWTVIRQHGLSDFSTTARNTSSLSPPVVRSGSLLSALGWNSNTCNRYHQPCGCSTLAWAMRPS